MNKEATAFSVVTFLDWQKFLEAAGPLLLDREAENNLIWEVGHASAENAVVSGPWSGWLVKEGDKPLLAALLAVTDYLILSAGEPTACLALASHLAEHRVSPKGVSGPEPVSSSFAEAWQGISGEPPVLGASLSFYLAPTDTKSMNETEEGFRLAQPTDRGLLRGWAIDFGAESPRSMDPSSLTRLNEKMLVSGNLFVWEDNQELVAMGGFGRATPHGLIINMVYVPGNRRGRGFAGALTTALVVEADRRGKQFCCLYSEFRSSVRTNLYERVGFRLAGEFTERAFDS